jgi:hypothetical protein
MSEVRADPVELARFADRLLGLSQLLADAWRTAQGLLVLPATAAGDSSRGPALIRAHESTVEEAEIALGRLVALLEGDTDRIYRIAFAYRQADQAAEDAVNRSTHPNIPT